jgi:Sulfotransferase family
VSHSAPTARKAYEHDEPPKLLYVGGFGRSGSTLVGRILGQADDSVCVGETCYLGTRGLLENVQCGCGQSFRACDFWSAVGAEAFGGWDEVDVQRLLDADRLTGRFRTSPFHWSLSNRPALAGAIDYYVTWLGRLYAAIARVSQAKIIVETSKDPYFAALLTRIVGCDLRIIHLVRDSRAVAYSWTRDKRGPSPIGEQQLMPQFRPADTAIRWVASNVAFHTLATKAASYVRINYEEFVASPSQALQELSAFAGSSLCLPPTQLRDHSVKLGDHHIFSGNPMRSRTGWLEVNVDDEWQRMLPPSQFTQVTALTWPLLRLYGYAIVSPNGRGGGSRGAHRSAGDPRRRPAR